MKILVVHDRAEVAQTIKEIVEMHLSGVDCEVVDSAAQARSSLSKTFYDLLILDLTIPTVSGRSAKGLEVAEALLEELMDAGTLLTPGHTLGITLDDNALDTIQNNIGPHLMAVIKEDEDSLWKKRLVDRLSYVNNSSAARSRALMTKYDYDLFIITALDKELSPYRDFFEFQEHPFIPGVSQFAFTDRAGDLRRGAAYSIGRAGQPSAASDTQGLLCQLRPRLAIMSGFCGGVPKKADLGDVLFAELALDWDYGKWKPSGEASRLYSRPEPVVIRNTRIHRIARELVQKGLQDDKGFHAEYMRLTSGEIQEPELKLVPFASGSAVIGDTDILESIKSLNEGVGGVDMESFGFYVACQNAYSAKPNFICIKAVADECGPEKDDRLHAGCCYASAFVAKEIVQHNWDFS